MAEEEVTRAPSTIPQFVWRIVDIIIGGVFIYAGAIKAFDPIRFANDIDNYKILPWAISVRVAFYLPWLEIFCGLALIARRLYLGGLWLFTELVFICVSARVSAEVRALALGWLRCAHVSRSRP